MNDLRIYQFIVGMREMIAKAIEDGVPMTTIYLALNDIQREVVKPAMEQNIKKQMAEDGKEAKPTGDPAIRAVE